MHASTAVKDCAVSAAVEVEGTIKWFNLSKGYGFITQKNGGSDVLLHITCLRARGYQTAREGATVRCLAVRGPKGMRALELVSMDESTAIAAEQESCATQRTDTAVQPESDWVHAMVKAFNRARGYGFLTRGKGTQDIFVHAKTLRRCGVNALRPDQIVEVRYGRGPKGLVAVELRMAG